MTSAVTPHLNLPYLAPSQAQKHVAVNGGLRLIDAMAQISVISRNTSTTQAEPDEGARYIMPVSPTGAWSRFSENSITFHADNAQYRSGSNAGTALRSLVSGNKLQYPQ